MFRLSGDPFPGQELTPEMLSSVDIDERFVPEPPGAPDVRALLYTPKQTTTRLPLILSMHGGAFARRPDMFPAGDARLAMLGALVVSVDYRIVPASRYPDAVEDCYSALCWAVEELPIDRTRVVITGASAGGALAAAVALIARDREGPNIKLQALIIPVLDDRCDTASMRQFEEAPLFGGGMARQMWDTYLGPEIDRSHTPAYAAPGRADNLVGLPPAFIQVGGLDPLRDEGVIYAQRLMAQGVPVELYCAPGQHHGLSVNDRTANQATQLFRSAIHGALS